MSARIVPQRWALHIAQMGRSTSTTAARSRVPPHPIGGMCVERIAATIGLRSIWSQPADEEH